MKMDKCRTEWKEESHKQARKKGENQRIQIKQGDKTSIGRKERKEGAECAMRRERQLSTSVMDIAKWGRERKERGKILNEDGREMGWMKEI
jgi:hypothetical protein